MNKADFPPSARRLWITALLSTSALCLLDKAFGATVNAVNAANAITAGTSKKQQKSSDIRNSPSTKKNTPSAMSNYLDTVEIESALNPSVAIIWMHGLGADANDFVPIVQELNLSGLPGIRFVFPNAPTMPVTINNGYVMRAWYDILGTDIARREDEKGLRASQAEIEKLIAREVARGIPANKIFLAGFSQGCAMTLQTGLRYPQKLAGLLCLSGYVPLRDVVAAERSAANQETPVFLVHGRADPVIHIQRAEQSRDLLKELGYQIEWHEYMMPHSVCAEEIRDIGLWLHKVLAA